MPTPGYFTCSLLAVNLGLLIASAVNAAPPLDEARLRTAGIRKISSRHLDLYTDLAPAPAIDELPRIFDLAVPQWCRYFEIELETVKDWRITASVMDRKERFQGCGLLPADLPPFLHGFQRGEQLWLYEQPSDYYRRHLLLHEGTHAFMNQWLGGTGPPWFMEGIAEMLGTHRWSAGRLTLNEFPASKEETPLWGRIKVIKDEVAAGRAMLLPKIMLYDARVDLRTEPYAWCWAAAKFLDSDPRTRTAFRDMRRHVQDPQLSARLMRQLQDWPAINTQWQLFVMELDYGYDLDRAVVNHVRGQPLSEQPKDVEIAADRGWQSTGIQVEAGKTYRLTASGRYQVADQPKIWWCEPGGVTIRYDRGRPLGLLLGAVDDPARTRGLTPLARPQPIGLQRTLTVRQSGVLYLKINESATSLADNGGTLRVRVTAD